MCVKKKMPDEVDQVWTYNGTIKYISKMNQACTLRYEDFKQWSDLAVFAQYSYVILSTQP